MRREVIRSKIFLALPPLLDVGVLSYSRQPAEGSYAVVSRNVGGGGGAGTHAARGALDADPNGDGKDVLLAVSILLETLSESLDDVRDGKSCESLLDPEVILCTSGGWGSHCSWACSVIGDPIWSPGGTETMVTSQFELFSLILAVTISQLLIKIEVNALYDWVQ